MDADNSLIQRPVQADALVSEVLTERPEAIAVFLRNRMACPGCVMARFMTVREAARSYQIDLDQLLRDLNEA